MFVIPLIPVLAGAVVGGLAWNSIDDALVDPISPAASSAKTIALIVGTAALMLLARKKGWL